VKRSRNESGTTVARILQMVKYYLLVFDREHHKLVDLVEFDDSGDAVRARFKCELELNNPEVEVVVLGAMSKEALKNTHSRYFGQGRELSPTG
jgi:hypothetical protein